jgi:hypothetical protein
MTESGERWPYGPNTRTVRRFLQRFAALAPDEWAGAAERFAAAEGTPRFRRADRALGAAVGAAGREGERDAALRPLAELLRRAERDGPDREEGELDPVAAAAVAAVLALVMRDVLAADTFDALYAPFAELIPVERLVT